MAPNPSLDHNSGLGLDVGERRLGIAIGRIDTCLARPLLTLDKPERFIDDIISLCQREGIAWIVIGLPRGMDGQETAQTVRVRDFGARLERRLLETGMTIPLYWTDEALTSAQAEAELEARGKKFAKQDVDALAATYILEDYLKERSTEYHG